MFDTVIIFVHCVLHQTYKDGKKNMDADPRIDQAALGIKSM